MSTVEQLEARVKDLKGKLNELAKDGAKSNSVEDRTLRKSMKRVQRKIRFAVGKKLATNQGVKWVDKNAPVEKPADAETKPIKEKATAEVKPAETTEPPKPEVKEEKPVEEKKEEPKKEEPKKEEAKAEEVKAEEKKPEPEKTEEKKD